MPGCGLCHALFIFAFGAGTAAAAPLDVPARLRQGLEQVRGGQYQSALNSYHHLRQEFPNHPLSYLIAAEAHWNLIFCETGHITSAEIWNVASVKKSTYDKEFQQDTERALEVARALRSEEGSEALGNFYVGLAHGVQARLYTLRAEALKSGGEGKQMRSSLLDAINEDPELAPDASVGLGAYNYYADVLSPLIKFFRFFMMIPGGDRQKGMEQLEAASQGAMLLSPEARYELARILGLREGRHADALALFAGLSEHYPTNAFYPLSAAFEAEQAGKKQAAKDFAELALRAAHGMDAVCRNRLEPSARDALLRLQ